MRGFGNFIGGALTQVADLALEGARALVDYAQASIELAGAAGETASLFEISLGPALDGYNERIDEIAAATGRSTAKFNEAVAPILAMSRSMGFAQDEAGELTATFGNLALDLNSFFNSDTAFQDIQSALSGSSETMAKYGINVKETVLQQAALEAGLIDSLGPLDQQTRALVILEEIQRQAADAVGDAARTADSAVNQQRALEDAYYDLQVQIGNELLPVQELLIESQLGLVEAYGDDAVRAVGGFATAIGDAATIVDYYRDAIEKFRATNPKAADFFFGTERETIFGESLVSVFADQIRNLEEISELQTLYNSNLDTSTVNVYEAAEAVTAQTFALEDQFAAYQALSRVVGEVAEKEQRQPKDVSGAEQLQSIYDAELQRLANIETTNANLERQAQARRDRERETLQALLDQNVELGALFEIGQELSDQTGAQALFESAQAAGLQIGDIVALAQATGDYSDSAIEAAADQALLTQKTAELTEAIRLGDLTTEAAALEYETFRQGLIDSKTNADELIDSVVNLNGEVDKFDGTRTATIDVSIPNIELLREAAALAAGFGSVSQVVGAFGGDVYEANNALERGIGAPRLPSTTTEAASRGSRQ